MALNPLLLRRKRPLRRQAKGIFLDQPLLQALDGRQILKGTFPNHEDVPAGLPQSGLITGVTLLSLADLFPPPIRPPLGEPEVFAVPVPVPVAAVDEDDRPELREDDVGTSGEFLFLDHFRGVTKMVLRYGGAYCSIHHPAAFFPGEDVGHADWRGQ